ncbi:MAG: LysR substrate-binding domain-containing protein [Nocardioides sp.]
MIDPHRLAALVAVHRTGSVSAAAAELHYGQPTISHHLRRLEAETGSVLLQRVGRGIRLTDDGVRLARRGEEILGLLARADEELAAATSLQAGRVRLAAFPSAAATVVPAAVSLLCAEAPGLTLELVEAEPPQAAELLRRGTVDLALTFGYDDRGPDEPDGLESEPLVHDPLMLVVSDAAPRRRGGDRLRDHADSRWVTGCERCRSELVALCADAGFEPAIGFASDDYVAVQALVASGFGVSILPALALRAHRHAGVRTTALPAARTVRLSTYGRPPRPAAVEAVADVVRRAARRM